jgi:tripartite-type tricarboxylate transporter receptor subunit TctC
VQFFMAPIANSVAQVKDGRLVGLGVSSPARDPLLPAVPTIDEAGVRGYQSELWFGLLAPAGVPQAVMAKLNAEIGRVLADADTKARWAPLGIEPRPTTPEAFDKLIRDDIALFTQIARSAGIKAE